MDILGCPFHWPSKTQPAPLRLPPRRCQGQSHTQTLAFPMYLPHGANPRKGTRGSALCRPPHAEMPNSGATDAPRLGMNEHRSKSVSKQAFPRQSVQAEGAGRTRGSSRCFPRCSTRGWGVGGHVAIVPQACPCSACLDLPAPALLHGSQRAALHHSPAPYCARLRLRLLAQPPPPGGPPALHLLGLSA